MLLCAPQVRTDDSYRAQRRPPAVLPGSTLPPHQPSLQQELFLIHSELSPRCGGEKHARHTTKGSRVSHHITTTTTTSPSSSAAPEEDALLEGWRDGPEKMEDEGGREGERGGGGERVTHIRSAVNSTDRTRIAGRRGRRETVPSAS